MDPPPMPLDANEIDRRFDHHPPDECRAERHKQIRQRAKELASYLNICLPDCRETSLAFTKLEEAMFWANAALARRGRDEKSP